MEYAAIPGFSDRVPRLIMGSVAFSTMRANDRKAGTADSVARLLDAYVERGGTAIETAHDYARGETEGIIGDWLRARGLRHEMLMMTKGAQHDQHLVRRVTPEAITVDLHESLARLGVDTVDFFMLHRDDPATPVASIIDCLNEHMVAGHIRAFGGSNWTHLRIDEAHRYAARHGRQSFAASSPNLALAVPMEPLWHDCLSVSSDAQALDWYCARQFPLISWSSQARGFFSGRFSPDDKGDPDVVRVYYNDENWERLRRARELASRLACTATQMALAWVLHQPFPTFALIGPRTVEELDDCIGALDIHLSPTDIRWLNLEHDESPVSPTSV